MGYTYITETQRYENTKIQPQSIIHPNSKNKNTCHNPQTQSHLQHLHSNISLASAETSWDWESECPRTEVKTRKDVRCLSDTLNTTKFDTPLIDNIDGQNYVLEPRIISYIDFNLHKKSLSSSVWEIKNSKHS